MFEIQWMVKICHHFLWPKDNRIIRDKLHCFYTMTKICISFEKGRKGACITVEVGASDWIHSCLLSPLRENSPVLFPPYKQNCNQQLLPNLCKLPMLLEHFFCKGNLICLKKIVTNVLKHIFLAQAEILGP